MTKTKINYIVRLMEDTCLNSFETNYDTYYEIITITRIINDVSIWEDKDIENQTLTLTIEPMNKGLTRIVRDMLIA